MVKDEYLLVLQVLLDLLLHGLLGLRVGHLLLRDDCLQVDLRLNHVAGGQQVVVVDELDEWLQRSALLNSLAAHLFSHFQWISVNAGNQSVGELLVLRRVSKLVLPSWCYHRGV